MISLISSTSASSIALMTPSNPKVSTIDSLPVSEGTVGQQLVITTTVQNNLNEAKPYATILEVRDSEGLAVAVNWQAGNMDAHGSTVTGMSWTPQKADTYQLRTFVLSGIHNARAYSVVESSEIRISEQ